MRDKKKAAEAYRRWWISVGTNPQRWAQQAMRSVKKRAKRRGIECNITADSLLPLPEICPLLGLSLDYSKGRGKGGFQDCSPSLDRIDNTKGYVVGNVWIISYRANSIKRDATLEELRTIAACLASAMRTISKGRKFQ